MARQLRPPTIVAICCQRCNAILATSDGATLILTAGRIAHQVTLTCVFCGAQRRWKPAQRPPVEPVCYTDNET